MATQWAVSETWMMGMDAVSLLGGVGHRAGAMPWATLRANASGLGHKVSAKLHAIVRSVTYISIFTGMASVYLTCTV